MHYVIFPVVMQLLQSSSTFTYEERQALKVFQRKLFGMVATFTVWYDCRYKLLVTTLSYMQSASKDGSQLKNIRYMHCNKRAKLRKRPVNPRSLTPFDTSETKII